MKSANLTEEQKKERKRRWRKKDYDTHRQAYIDRAIEWSKKQKEENPEEWAKKRKEIDRLYHAKLRKDPITYAKMLASNHKAYWKDPQRYRDCANKYSKKVKWIVFNHYGLSCACCGESLYEFLTIDHINNDGAKQRKEIFGPLHRSGAGTAIYKWLIKNNFPEGFQTLCWNCNCGKRINNGVCPHKKGEIINETTCMENEKDGYNKISKVVL